MKLSLAPPVSYKNGKPFISPVRPADQYHSYGTQIAGAVPLILVGVPVSYCQRSQMEGGWTHALAAGCFLWSVVHRLRHLGHDIGFEIGCRKPADAGNRSRRARRRASVSQASIHD